MRSRLHGATGWEELEDGVIVAAQPHGAPSWFPCNERPDDKALYEIRLAVNPAYHVAVSGELQGTRRKGNATTWTYLQQTPMPTYLATVQIGRYSTVEHEGAPVPVRSLVAAGVGARELAHGFATQPEMLMLFSRLFGPYPFPSSTAVITEDELEIPLESQALSTFRSNHLADDWEAERLIAHELSHQWFGTAVTLKRWQDIWLHEGFACYCEWLWAEETGRSTVEEEAHRHHAALAALPEDLLVADPGPELMFDDRLYKRGALTVHALRRRLGDEVFFPLIQSWLAAHAGGSAARERGDVPGRGGHVEAVDVGASAVMRCAPQRERLTGTSREPARAQGRPWSSAPQRGQARPPRTSCAATPSSAATRSRST